MTQSTPSATLNDLATAAVVAYNTGKSGEPAMGSQWTQISQAKILEKLPSSLSQGDIDAKGFSGQLYVNQQTGEVIIADRGTIANVQNIISDVQISVGARQQAQTVADQFAAAALQAAQEQLGVSGVQVSVVYTTGHSLGGAESMGQAAFLSSATNPDGSTILPSGVKITNASFDAPGISSLSTTGNSSNYTSYNFSAQGDVVHLAGGGNLEGTVGVSLPVGPSMWATGGLIGLGLAAPIPLVGSSFVALGLSNAADAHSSVALQTGLVGTALGSTPLSQLAGLNPTQMQNLYGVTPAKFAEMTPAQQAALIGKAPTTADAPVYGATGFDQNGYGKDGYNIYGQDKNGNLDPSIAQNGGRTNTDILSDGSTVTVVIAKDGAIAETLNTADGTVYTYNRNASGQLTGVTTQSTDGIIQTQKIDPTTGAITESVTSGGTLIGNADIQSNTGGGSTSLISDGRDQLVSKTVTTAIGTTTQTDYTNSADVNVQTITTYDATGKVTGITSVIPMVDSTGNVIPNAYNTSTTSISGDTNGVYTQVDRSFDAQGNLTSTATTSRAMLGGELTTTVDSKVGDNDVSVTYSYDANKTPVVQSLNSINGQAVDVATSDAFVLQANSQNTNASTQDPVTLTQSLSQAILPTLNVNVNNVDTSASTTIGTTGPLETVTLTDGTSVTLTSGNQYVSTTTAPPTDSAIAIELPVVPTTSPTTTTPSTTTINGVFITDNGDGAAVVTTFNQDGHTKCYIKRSCLRTYLLGCRPKTYLKTAKSCAKPTSAGAKKLKTGQKLTDLGIKIGSRPMDICVSSY